MSETRDGTSSLTTQRPGGSLPEWNLYESRIGTTETGTKQLGVKTPDNKYFEFNNGEQIVFIQDNTGRNPHIKLDSGNTVSFEAWRNSRRENIRQVLEQSDPKYAELYMFLIEDYPELESLEITSGTKEQFPVLEYTGGFWKRPSDLNTNPSIVVALGTGSNHSQSLFQDREFSARRAAKDLEVDYSLLQQNPELLGLFIFLHEIGHAHEYINEYANNPEFLDKGIDPSKENENVREKEMMSLPVPNANPVRVKQMYTRGELTQYFDLYRQYYLEKGISSAEELVTAQERSYKDLPTEKYADQFAAQVLKKHWQQLGLGSI
jgi:hypothetical protein